MVIKEENLCPVPVPGTDQALKNVKFMIAFFHLVSMQLVLPKCYRPKAFSKLLKETESHMALFIKHMQSYTNIYHYCTNLTCPSTIKVPAILCKC